MANLLARFQMVDEMSSRLDQLAQRGQTIVSSFERLGDIGTAAFSGIERGASSAVTTADGVAHSLSDLVGTTGNAASHTDALSESLSRYGDAAGTAASHTDDWADSIEDYGESASTAADAAQSLADAGEKSAEALREQERRFDECELSAHALSRTMEEAADTQKDLSEAMERASRTASELADNENVSTEAKEELARAAETAEDAMRGLEAAQNEAVAAMENYDAVLTSGTDNMDELEAAAERNRQAAEKLAEADGKAADAARELSEATDRAADEAERSSKRGQDAAQKLGNVLAAAGIAVAINKIKDAFLDASNAAAAFQTGIAKVSTIADTTNVSLGEIESQISALSRETGQSVTGLSEAVYSAISASVDTASAGEFTGTATKLAAGGFTAASTAVDVLTTALNAYGLEASEAGSISDMLITTQNLGKTSVDELASSVGKVIPLAAAYGVEMDNLSAAYAELTKGGIATAESGTYLKSMLNELGDSASTVSTTLIEQTGYSFAELTKQGYSLGDVMEVLGNSVQGDAGAFNELWSSSEAGIGALSLYNAGAAQFNTTLDAMRNSVGATESAYSAMTNTVEHSQEALSVASENLNIAIGQNLNPLVQSLYDGGTRLLNTMTEFATEHPLAVKALAAIAIGVGGVTAAIAAASGVATLASATIMPFFAGLAAAMGPVGLLIAGFAAAGVAIGAFAAMAGDASDETLAMTATTRKQYLELQDLNAQYEEACAKYGETSDQASSLKWQIDDLTASLEANGKTVEQLAAECDSVIDKHNQLINSTNSATQAVKDQEVQNLALIAKLESMASAANISAESQGVMEGIIKELNRNIDGLNLSYEELTGNQEAAVASLKQYARAQAEQAIQQAKIEEYVEYVKQQAEEEAKLAEIEEELAAAAERVAEANAAAAGARTITGGVDPKAMAELNAAVDAQNTLTEKQRELQAALDETTAHIEGIESAWEAAGGAAEDASAQTVTYEQAAATAFQSVQAEIEELCEAYDEAYAAAKESFEGQFGLFDEASTK
ncbi:MAG: phage tail tape measure protein, partial [Oscillibacter sp.]|nr:phage tail tape measure protein [Oscillibacter sp.]